MYKMEKILFVITILVIGNSDARTVNAEKGDVEVTRGHSPLMTHKNLPLIKPQSGGGLAPGLNDIQGGLVDKIDNLLVEAESKGLPLTTPHVPTVAEVDDLVEAAVEEEPEVAIEADVVEFSDLGEDEEEFDAELFHSESDMVLVMRRMYEALTKRLSVLKNRVSTVEQTTSDILARLTDLDCYDLQTRGRRESGIYTLHMDHHGKRPVDVSCDMETDGGGWTIIQRRTSHSRDIDFNRGWYDYKMGFGNVSADYWIGLENIFIWTNTRHYELRIDLADFEGNGAYARYDHFYIESEDDGYRLHISGYSGTAGDSMGNEGKVDNFTADGMMFTTFDEDHDTSHEINCAHHWNIGGWWFNRCSWANLNGPYREPGEGDGIGINWHMWKNKEYLKSSVMMIRPTRSF